MERPQKALAALLFAAAIIQPEVANADDGGFQGGGFHHGFGHFRAVFGFGGIFPPFWWSPFWWGYGYPPRLSRPSELRLRPGSSYYGNYPDSGYGSQPNARQTWYYCPNPAGYYPSVTHCNTVWQYGPGSARNRDRAASAHGSHVGK
jgi:hypothetical protein